jgi:hypothetical protein
MTTSHTGDGWNASPIEPKPPTRSVSLSVRIPLDVYEQLERYAKEIRAPRSYLVVECLRRVLSTVPLPTPEPEPRRPARRRR